jgi:hypothetical protein
MFHCLSNTTCYDYFRFTFHTLSLMFICLFVCLICTALYTLMFFCHIYRLAVVDQNLCTYICVCVRSVCMYLYDICMYVHTHIYTRIYMFNWGPTRCTLYSLFLSSFYMFRVLFVPIIMSTTPAYSHRFVWFAVLFHWSRYWFGTPLHLSTVIYTYIRILYVLKHDVNRLFLLMMCKMFCIM